MIKICVICGKEFETPTGSIVCSAECKQIRDRNTAREKARRRRLRDMEHIRELNRLSRLRHREEINLKQRKYYKKHKKEVQARNKLSYQKFIEKRRAAKRKYNAENHELILKRGAIQRAKRRIREKLEGGRTYCAVCGKYFQEEYQGQKYCSAECRNNFSAKNMRKFFTKIFNKMIG